MTRGEKISEARKDKGWTQKVFHQELVKNGLRVSYGWVANLETDRIKRLDKREFEVLAKVLKIPVEQIANDMPGGSSLAVREALATYQAERVIYVPVVGVVSAERFTLSFDAFADEYLPIVFKGPIDQKIAAVKIKGSCMEPTAHDGEYAVVVQTNHVDDGRLAVVRNGDECTLKRVFRRKDHVELKPDNPAFKSLKVKPDEFQVIGIVVGFFRKP